MTNRSVITWTDLCPTGIRIFVPDTRQLEPCFQQLFLHLPILTFLAIVSAFLFGKLSSTPNTYSNVGRRQNRAKAALFFIQITTLLGLVLTPSLGLIVQMMTMRLPRTAEETAELWPIDVIVAGFQTVAFSMHFSEYILDHIL